MRLKSLDWVPPAIVDEYRLVRPLGSGGMGQVYLAHDQLLDRPVAVKFIAAIEPDERRRARFLNEGRAIARLSHPNVVLVHRVGEVEGRPYLVSEYVRGRPLDSLPKPVERGEVARIGAHLARGLAAAHRQGVLHRDLKPANAVLADGGEVKLLDFGLAKLLSEIPVEPPGGTVSEGSAAPSRDEPKEPQPSGEAAELPSEITRAGAVLGTPAYMAPETLRGEIATRASDIFSLGAVLFELATGTLPRPPRRAGQPHEMLSLAVAAKVRERAPSLDPALATIIDRCLEHAPDRRFPSADELAEALSALEPASQPRAVPQGNPYRGLHAFEAEHRDLFFGRDPDVRAVLERVRSEPLVLVAGDSGVGKSSLCRAGVLPLVAEGALESGRSWSVVTLIPGRRPVTALCAALAQSLDAPEEALGAWIRSEPAALARALRQRFQKTGIATLLFFDQLEELLTLSEPAEAALLAEALGHLSVPAMGTRVLAAVRGDFFTRLAALPGLGPEVSRALYLLRPLTAEQIRATVVGPARCKGVTFESDALVTTLVTTTAAAAGGLPLLQFALAELWDARDATAGVIREDALKRIGGVEGALARHADGVLAAMLPEQRAAARGMLLGLVTSVGTRARRTDEELAATSGPRAAALEALVHGRLVVARSDQAPAAYEVAHEALLESWGTLKQWLDVEGDRQEIRQRIQLAALEWERHARPTELLWHERQLAEANRIDAEQLGAKDRSFIGASIRSVRRGRLRRRAVLVLAPLIALTTVAAWRVAANRAIDVRVSEHLSNARSAADRARRLDSAAAAKERSALERFEQRTARGIDGKPRSSSTSWRLGEEEWGLALQLQEQADREYAAAQLAAATAASFDPRRADIRALSLDALLARLALARRANRPDRVLGLSESIRALDPDNAQAVAMRAPARLTIRTEPAYAQTTLSRYETTAGRTRLSQPTDLGPAPLETPANLAPGSYLVTLSAEGYAPARLPLVLSAGDHEVINLRLPKAKEVPRGFLYIPAGRYLTGSAGDESLRVTIEAAPLHLSTTGAFLIARDEVTFADWIDYLDHLPAEERARRSPSVVAHTGALKLDRDGTGRWELMLQPTTRRYRAAFGEPIRYQTRLVNAVQDWARFPVSGISLEDARSYAAWLAATGRVRGARLCWEDEWERAARGADGRDFTTGSVLAPADANFDLTYGRDPDAFGPDEVGSHPESESPFGLRDAQGNAQEMVLSVRDTEEAVHRGGGWYRTRLTGRLANRTALDRTTRGVVLGFRLCASISQ